MKIYLVPTQHWDPFWVFAPEVSEKMGVRNLHKALDIIKKNPDFKYAFGQVYLWELFQKHLPERVEEFKQRVKEGKIILTCGGYVNPDFNLPSGESLIRQLSFNKRIWHEEFGESPKTVWIQDSFGQSAQLPQIFTKLGLKFHTAKRGAKKDLPAVFVWEGVDGSKILFDRQPLGHHGLLLFPGFSAIPNRIKPWRNLEKIADFPPFLWLLGLAAVYLPDPNLWIATKGSFWRFKSALRYLKKLYPGGIFLPHGFGFDGALPVGYIAKLVKIHNLLSRDKMLISSPSEFITEMERRRDSLLTVKGELNGPHRKSGEGLGVLPGTYSTRIDAKQRARQMERSLYLAELLETLKYLKTGSYRDFTEIWKLKFLNDFHDGICGSSTDDNYKLLKQKAEDAISQCQIIISRNLEEMALGDAVFNPLPWQRKDIVSLDGELKLAEAAALGFSALKTLELEERMQFDEKENVLTTPFYKVEWKSGLKIWQGQKLITGDGFARFRLQEEKGDAYFWDVSQNTKDWKWDKIQSIKLAEYNKLKAVLEIKSGFPGIEISQKISFYCHTARVDFETEVSNGRKDIRLQAHLPVNAEKGVGIEREIPAGFIAESASPGQAKWREVFGERFAYYDSIKCVQNWLFFGNEEGVAVFNDGLPEHELTENGCLLTLLRCVGRIGTKEKGLFKPKNVPWRAGSPGPIPLAQLPGEHKFKYAFCPCQIEDVARECYEFLFPLQFCQGHQDLKQESSSFFSISDKNIVPLAVKKAEREDKAAVRLLETGGEEKDVEIRFSPDIKIKTAYLADLTEERISDLALENNVLRFRIKPQEIITIILGK